MYQKQRSSNKFRLQKRFPKNKELTKNATSSFLVFSWLLQFQNEFWQKCYEKSYVAKYYVLLTVDSKMVVFWIITEIWKQIFFVWLVYLNWRHKMKSKNTLMATSWLQIKVTWVNRLQKVGHWKWWYGKTRVTSYKLKA